MPKNTLIKLLLVNVDQVCAAIKSIFEETAVSLSRLGALATAGIQAIVSKLRLDLKP